MDNYRTDTFVHWYELLLEVNDLPLSATLTNSMLYAFRSSWHQSYNNHESFTIDNKVCGKGIYETTTSRVMAPYLN